MNHSFIGLFQSAGKKKNVECHFHQKNETRIEDVGEEEESDDEDAERRLVSIL
jgi:hypothetical protein